jgi:hypothetical protein
MQEGTGTLWRIRRTAGPAGDRPPKPRTFPFYVLQTATWIAAPIALVALIGLLFRRGRRAS